MEMRIEGKTFHQAEEQLIEFAETHLFRESKYKEAANRIMLTKAVKSLFADNVGYHHSCYDNFRSPS